MRHTEVRRTTRERFDDLSLRLDLTYDPITTQWGIAAYASDQHGRFKTKWLSTGCAEPSLEHLAQALAILEVASHRWHYVHSSHQLSLLSSEEVTSDDH